MPSRAVCFGVYLSVIGSVCSALADTERGMRAYHQGDYETALREFSGPATLGDPMAQFNLGVMYHEGFGVLQNLDEARRWYRKAAEKGLGIAQVNLGAMCVVGAGGEKDYVEAYMWFSLASAGGNEKAKEAKSLLKARMPAEEIAEARRRALEWEAKR
jgi:TPR repeat protein